MIARSSRTYAQEVTDSQGRPKRLSDGRERKWKLGADAAARYARIKLKDGYANLSHRAMRLILPFLEKGCVYSHAVALGGVRRAFGEKKWQKMSQARREEICNKVLDIVSKKNEENKDEGGYIEPLKRFLEQEFGLRAEDLKKLYHHSDQRIDKLEEQWSVPAPDGSDEKGKEADKEIQLIRNPVVITALFELRKIVNTLIDTYGAPSCIKIELARDLKQGAKQRNETRARQKTQEKERLEAINELSEQGLPTSEGNILRYRLWKEAGCQCVYSGQKIGVSELCSEQVEVDHIHPHSRSLDG